MKAIIQRAAAVTFVGALSAACGASGVAGRDGAEATATSDEALTTAYSDADLCTPAHYYSPSDSFTPCFNTTFSHCNEMQNFETQLWADGCYLLEGPDGQPARQNY